jgi:hypothetical protein
MICRFANGYDMLTGRRANIQKINFEQKILFMQKYFWHFAVQLSSMGQILESTGGFFVLA